ncbi:MAG TPA: hypothetical protein QF468_03435, partial [Nitrospinota bacterium]|nr:hypothetical protein [Nitrospinota bacterium]
TTSVSLILLMICSALKRFRAIIIPPFLSKFITILSIKVDQLSGGRSKIPNSLLRGASIVVAALPGRVLSNLCGKKKRFYMFVVLMK